MAGRPITKDYKRKIKVSGGLGQVFNQLAEGKNLTTIAREMAVSVAFLHYYVVAAPGGRAAMWMARYMATEAKARESLERSEPTGNFDPDALTWLRVHGGFRQAAGSESSANANNSPVYVSQRQAENGRLHLEALMRRGDQERGNPTAPSTLPWLRRKTD